MAMGLALVHRQSPDCERGLDMLERVREMALQERYSSLEMPLADVYAAREQARRGDRRRALPLMRDAIEVFFKRAQFPWCIAATDVLVETLLDNAAESEIAEAREAVDRLAAAISDDFVLGEIMLLRMRAALSCAQGDDVAYREFVDRYRAMAKSRGLEGHIARAEAMT